jgi:hypothetical protein
MDGFVEKLEVAIHKHMLDAMPASVREGLQPLSLSDLTIQYLSWRARLIPARPRRCHRSAELAASPKATEHQTELDAIVAKIRTGEDLTAHLSKGIANPVTDDPMMADWRIHHLHLSTAINDDGFTKRSGDLLFAAIDPDDAYLIGIYPHGTWTRQEIAEIPVRNWQGAGRFIALGPLKLAEPNITEQEREQARKSGMLTLIDVDEQAYRPAGITTAGTSIDASRYAHELMNTLGDWRQHTNRKLATARQELNRRAQTTGARKLGTSDPAGTARLPWLASWRENRCSGGRLA